MWLIAFSWCCALLHKIQSFPLYISVRDKDVAREFELQLFVYCSLDIVDEKIFGEGKTQELYLGPLISNQNFKVCSDVGVNVIEFL